MPEIEVMRAIEVLTLEEAATYLRVSPEALLRQVIQRNLPGRKIEDSWRFLKTAIDDWLRASDSQNILLQQIGLLADDESLADLRTEIYQARERPEVDEDSAPNL